MKKIILLLAAPILISAAEPVTVQPVRIRAHIAEKPSAPPPGNSVSCKNGVYTLTYRFTTEKHDALFFDLDLPLEEASELTAQVNGDGKGHTLFAVVRDRSGQCFYFPGPAITFKGWKNIRIKFKYPKINPGEKYASIWGGDGSQQTGFPLRGITLGLNDTPDTSTDSGEILIRNLKVK